jgi:hypothetical protein
MLPTRTPLILTPYWTDLASQILAADVPAVESRERFHAPSPERHTTNDVERVAVSFQNHFSTAHVNAATMNANSCRGL